MNAIDNLMRVGDNSRQRISQMNKKIISLLIIFCFVLGATACFGEKNSHEFEFTRDYIESLSLLKTSLDRHKKTDPNNVNYQSETEMILTFMKNFRLDNDDLGAAKGLIDKYVDSEDKVIEQTVLSILTVYDKLIKMNVKSLKLYEKLYSPEAVNNPEKFNQGVFMSYASKLIADRRETEKRLLEANFLATITLISDVPDEEGLLSYLTINSEEREELIEMVNEIFSGEITAESKNPELNYIDSCGAAIRVVLVGDRKSADER